MMSGRGTGGGSPMRAWGAGGTWALARTPAGRVVESATASAHSERGHGPDMGHGAGEAPGAGSSSVVTICSAVTGAATGLSGMPLMNSMDAVQAAGSMAPRPWASV